MKLQSLFTLASAGTNVRFKVGNWNTIFTIIQAYVKLSGLLRINTKAHGAPYSRDWLVWRETWQELTTDGK
jgi:hypothetical protein